MLVNWALDDEELLEPYEWQEEDDLEEIGDQPLLLISSGQMYDLYYGIIQFSNLDDGDYLVCDGKLSLAIRLLHHGELAYRSVLPFGEREVVLKKAQGLSLRKLTYEVLALSEVKEFGLTRYEKEKKQWLLEHVSLLSEGELAAVWQIVFPLDINVSKRALMERLEMGYTHLHEYLYRHFVIQKNCHKDSF